MDCTYIALFQCSDRSKCFTNGKGGCEMFVFTSPPVLFLPDMMEKCPSREEDLMQSSILFLKKRKSLLGHKITMLIKKECH